MHDSAWCANPTRSRWLFGGELLIAGITGTGLFVLTDQPVIWVVAGFIGGAAACRITRARNRPAPPSARIRKSGQVVIGAAIGPTVAAQELSLSLSQVMLLSAGVVAILASALLVARLYSAFGRVDGITAGMATLPGGVGVMPSVAAEYGRPVSLVALVQSFRMTFVVIVVLVVFALLGPDDPTLGGHHDTTAFVPRSGREWSYVAVLLVGSIGAARLAGKIRIPVPTLLGPLLYGCLFSIALRAAGTAPELLEAPFLQEIVGQVLLGITVGEYLAQRHQGELSALAGGLVGVVATCAIAMLIAFGMTLLSPWSFLTTLLMVAPGGAPEMVVIAAATGGELPLVLAAQTGRQVLVNILIPLWIKIFGSFGQRSKENTP